MAKYDDMTIEKALDIYKRGYPVVCDGDSKTVGSELHHKVYEYRIKTGYYDLTLEQRLAKTNKAIQEINEITNRRFSSND